MMTMSASLILLLVLLFSGNELTVLLRISAEGGSFFSSLLSIVELLETEVMLSDAASLPAASWMALMSLESDGSL